MFLAFVLTGIAIDKVVETSVTDEQEMVKQFIGETLGAFERPPSGSADVQEQ